jgi:hypothetical protein
MAYSSSPMRTAIQGRRAQLLNLPVDDTRTEESVAPGAHPDSTSKLSSRGKIDVDDSKLEGGSKPFHPNHDPHGDLAPDGEGTAKGEVEEKKAIHAKYQDKSSAHSGPNNFAQGEKLEGDTLHNESRNPEHVPVARGMGADTMGHEQSNTDEDIERHLMEGYNEAGHGRVPRTLGAKVRLALQSKKTKKEGF